VVTEGHLAAIARINPAVNAFCTVVPEKALAWAREAEGAVKKRVRLGPLNGVPGRDQGPHRHGRHTAPPSARSCFATKCPPEDAEGRQEA